MVRKSFFYKKHSFRLMMFSTIRKQKKGKSG